MPWVELASANADRQRAQGTAPENRVAMTAELLIALFVGLSVPVIGAGVALDQGASAPNTVLGFAILVGRCCGCWMGAARAPAEELAASRLTKEG